MLQLIKSKYLLTNIYILITSLFGFAVLLTDVIQKYQPLNDFILILVALFISFILIAINIVKLFGNDELKYTEHINSSYLILQFFQFLIYGIGFKFVLGPQFLLLFYNLEEKFVFDTFQNLWKLEIVFLYDVNPTDFSVAINLIPIVFVLFNYVTKKETIYNTV